jgi:hypothetical protein
MSPLVKIGIAATLGVAGFALTTTAAYKATQHTDPSFGTIARNAYIAAAVIGGAGLLFAMKKNPLFGAALAGGALAAGFGQKVSNQLSRLIPEPKPAMAAIYGQDMSGYQQLAGYVPMAAVYGQDMAGMAGVLDADGEYIPARPF